MSFSQEFKQKLATIEESSFEELALSLYEYQLKSNSVYAAFVENLNRKNVNRLEEIPFLPISFFKNHKIVSGDVEGPTIFESSGTTGVETSKHYVADVEFYLQNAQRIFEQKYGSLEEYIVLALLPSYLERKGSSLVAMTDYFIRLSNHELSGFYLDNHQKLISNLKSAQQSGRKVLLIGVTFGLLDLVENNKVNLSGVTVMETGGMKGRRKELTRKEVHEILHAKGNAQEVHSEYGMTELLSQAYSSGRGVFDNSSTLKCLMRDISDPLTVGVESGGINVIDLANVDSCAFIETQDMGRDLGSGKFEVLGRLDNSDIRGCNLMID